MMKPFSGKKILLAAPVNYGIYKMLINELTKLGFEVYDFSEITDDFRYKSIWQRLHNLMRKVIFNDYENKRKLRKQYIEDRLNERARSIERVDYALFIRPDMFPLSFVETVRKITDNLVAYQWDGLSRYPEIKHYLDKFHRFFVFDFVDVAENRLPITNFCAEADGYDEVEFANSEPKAFFIGHYSSDRFEDTLKLKEKLNDLGVDCQFMVSAYDKKDKEIVKASNCIYISEQLEYLDALKLAKKADILVDLNISVHKGLSFRCFEALNFQKKLITTNESIQNYDFYDADNIFIWNRSNVEGLSDFLSKPIRPVLPEIRKKYGFENWIKYLLDHGKYQPINIPKL